MNETRDGTRIVLQQFLNSLISNVLCLDQVWAWKNSDTFTDIRQIESQNDELDFPDEYVK